MKNINAFQRQSTVYCAKCTNKPDWRPVNLMYGSLKDGVPMYGFECHGEELLVDAEEFNDRNSINGPGHQSYIVFNKQEDVG